MNSNIEPRGENEKISVGKVVGAATIAGAIFGLKMVGWTADPPAQFQFRQQVGDDRLTVEIRGDDRDGNGVLELSELEDFAARRGDQTWEKEDLEVFALNLKPEPIAGLNVFARRRGGETSSILEISDSNIYGLEYGKNQGDRVLFSEPNAPESATVESPAYPKLLKVFGLFGVGALLIALEWVTRDRDPILDPSPNSAGEPG
ncbi:hypothetical protein [Lyngbya sp. CCY1209]|uniref:hypothetical protein n=1 Tax=Lyngbya sp. CCY1209 TaxID=2886103 RepID=UPI002D217C02|nr:hypothetical protein [Lyngbya sp. CCY1209]MEB3884209.1 hypothetical protein [Lyngbya sp. CCY1209]